jgi:hypothetical protein
MAQDTCMERETVNRRAADALEDALGGPKEEDGKVE